MLFKTEISSISASPSKRTRTCAEGMFIFPRMILSMPFERRVKMDYDPPRLLFKLMREGRNYANCLDLLPST